MKNGALRPALLLPILQGRTRVLIEHRPDAAEAVLAALQRVDAKIQAQFHLVPLIAADCPHDELSRLAKDPNIVHIEPDLPVRFLAQTDGWHLRRTQVVRLWDMGYTGRGAQVAVLDTGIHPDLSVVGGVNLIDRTGWEDAHGHGTAVASVIGARAEDGVGVKGIAPDASLHAVKVLNDRGIGSVGSVIAGLEWCVDNRMHIAHLSLGTVRHARSLRRACVAAFRAGCLIVAAAGNGGNRRATRDTISCPARFPSVLAVGALGQRNRRAPFSATGAGLNLMAPGVEIACCVPGGFRTLSGTSVASACVSGVASLLIEARSATGKALRNTLVRSARPCGPRHLYGWGRIDAVRALAIDLERNGGNL